MIKTITKTTFLGVCGGALVALVLQAVDVVSEAPKGQAPVMAQGSVGCAGCFALFSPKAAEAQKARLQRSFGIGEKKVGAKSRL